MSDDDLTITVPRGVDAIALFGNNESMLLMDNYADSSYGWCNPVKSAVLAARLRAWADLIESRVEYNQ